MTTSILNDTLLLRNQPLERIRDYLRAINLTIFDDIIAKYKEESKQIILYILCAYSEESPLLILKRDSWIEKNSICEYLEILEEKRKTLVELRDNYVRTAVTEYVSQFAGEMFRSLMFMKIQLKDLEIAITNREYYVEIEKKNESGVMERESVNYDWKELRKSVEQHALLAKKIQDIEKQLLEKTKRLSGIEDIQVWIYKNSKKQSTSSNGTYRSSGLEHSDLIK